MRPIDWKKYAFAFLITAVIFFTAVFLSSLFGERRIQEIRSIQDQISLDILSSEVQTSLLEEFSCKEVGNSILSEQLNSLGERLSYAEETRGSDDEEVAALKKYYSLLQIKDYLLMRQVNKECNADNVFILYFYQKGCEDCERQGYVLTRLREDYPQLRVYSFDYDLEVPAIKTLISINRIGNGMPALLIEDKAYYGFQSIEDIEVAIPRLEEFRRLNASTTKATTTQTR